MAKLKGLLDVIEGNKRELPQFNKKWDIKLRDLQYLESLYQAQHAEMDYDYLCASNHQPLEEVSNKGVEAITYWQDAIDAKKAIIEDVLEDWSYSKLCAYWDDNMALWPSFNPQEEKFFKQVSELMDKKKALQKDWNARFGNSGLD